VQLQVAGAMADHACATLPWPAPALALCAHAACGCTRRAEGGGSRHGAHAPVSRRARGGPPSLAPARKRTCTRAGRVCQPARPSCSCHTPHMHTGPLGPSPHPCLALTPPPPPLRAPHRLELGHIPDLHLAAVGAHGQVGAAAGPAHRAHRVTGRQVTQLGHLVGAWVGGWVDGWGCAGAAGQARQVQDRGWTRCCCRPMAQGVGSGPPERAGPSRASPGQARARALT
jgi:hypothetical protein